MSGQKTILATFGFVLSVSLIASALAVMLVSSHCSRLQFDLLNVICGEVLEQEPEAKKVISAALKEYTSGNADGVAENDVLSVLGYRISDFSDSAYRQNALFVTVVFLTGVLLFIVTLLYRNKMEAMRIRTLADYLEQVNTGKAVILSTSGEDDFSKLEDEIYKTVTFLYQTKDAAAKGCYCTFPDLSSGIFSSIGATPKQVRACLLQEAAALCTVPVLVGNLLGIVISMGLLQMVNVLLGSDVAGRHEAVFPMIPEIMLCQQTVGGWSMFQLSYWMMLIFWLIVNRLVLCHSFMEPSYET